MYHRRLGNQRTQIDPLGFLPVIPRSDKMRSTEGGIVAKGHERIETTLI